MKLTYSEVFRFQQIRDNLDALIKIAEESRIRELENYEVQKCINLVENCGAEFYMVIENIRDRELSKEIENA